MNKNTILDWRTSFAIMVLFAFGGPLGFVLNMWSKNTSLMVFSVSGLFALVCIVRGYIMVENGDRMGWVSTYSGALLFGALIPVFGYIQWA
jgi:hypothetical protein